MRHQDHYARSDVNQLVAAQMQHMAVQRMHHNPGLEPYAGRSDAIQLEAEQRYAPLKSESQWQWDGKDPKGGPTSLGSHLYREGPENINSYQGQKSDLNSVMEKAPSNTDTRASDHHEQDMEIGYEEAQLPETLEALDQKFMDETLRLTTEQQDAEKEESARHLKRMREIDEQYQAKLSTIWARHRNQLEDLIRREAQLRHQQYQHAARSQYQHGSVGAGDLHGYGASFGDGPQGYPTRAYDAYRERMQSYGNASHPHPRNPAYDVRGPYPGGRIYDTNPRYY
ncbi:uncharacterized protein LOC116267801 [Nymphaea colorata]|nr:uncharacterized protein LOC116267801 [Nymphaea colorata]XP_031505571.1 uncharacterized protein LOC116267801 [Nymphaea colorata]